MLNGDQAVRAGGAAGLVAERPAHGGCGPSGARQKMAGPQPVRARQMPGRARPRATEIAVVRICSLGVIA